MMKEKIRLGQERMMSYESEANLGDPFTSNITSKSNTISYHYRNAFTKGRSSCEAEGKRGRSMQPDLYNCIEAPRAPVQKGD